MIGDIVLYNDTRRTVDVWLGKFDPAGVLLWNITWGGWDWANSGIGVVVDCAGCIYTLVNSGALPWESFFISLTKFNSTGGVIWNNTWGEYHYSESEIEIQGNGFAVDCTGNAYVIGQSYYESNSSNLAWLKKFNNTGNEVWTTTFNGSTNRLHGITLDCAGNSFICGDNNRDVLLMKFDNEGNEEWKTTWAKGTDYIDIGRAITLGTNGSIYITGSVYSNSPRRGDVLVAKFIFGNCEASDPLPTILISVALGGAAIVVIAIYFLKFRRRPVPGRVSET